MKKILFTRAIDMAYKSILHNAGFEVLEYNFLKTTPLPSAQADILKELPHFKNLVFTSQHAVKIFFAYLNSSQLNSLKLNSLKLKYHIFSTSEATKDLIEKYGHSPTLSAPSAKVLAQLMLEKADLSVGVHFLCGNLSLPHLPDILSKNGVLVKKVAVYETVATPLSISEPFDAIAFLSLSAADSFLQANTLKPDTLIFTLGQTTADYVRKKTGAKRIFAAKKPTISALIDLILTECT